MTDIDIDTFRLSIVLKLFNRVWDSGQVPSVWKQAIIVQKPGKDPSDPSIYRPIALTSHLYGRGLGPHM